MDPRAELTAEAAADVAPVAPPDDEAAAGPTCDGDAAATPSPLDFLEPDPVLAAPDYETAQQIVREQAAHGLEELAGEPEPVAPVTVASDAPPPAPPPLRPEDVLAGLACFGMAAVAAWPLWALVRAVLRSRRIEAGEWAGVLVGGAILAGLVSLLAYWGIRSLTWRRDKWWRSRRTRRRLCGRCGYDLRFAHNVCPECGWVMPESYESMAAKLDQLGPPMFVAVPQEQVPPPPPRA